MPEWMRGRWSGPTVLSHAIDQTEGRMANDRTMRSLVNFESRIFTEREICSQDVRDYRLLLVPPVSSGDDKNKPGPSKRN